MTLSGGILFSSAGGNLRQDRGGKCDKPVRLPQLFPYFGPSTSSSNSSAPPPIPYPRADMPGSPDPLRSDTAELILAPGRYSIGFVGGTGTRNCAVGAGMDLQAGRQYHVDFRFDTLAHQCIIKLEQLDEVGGVWRTEPFIKTGLCKES